MPITTTGVYYVGMYDSNGCLGPRTPFTVTITTDITPPVITCPVNQSFSANTSNCSYSGIFTTVVTDDCTNQRDIIITYTLSGATVSTPEQYSSLNGVVFNQGVTTVTVKAYDGANNSSLDCTYNLTIDCVLPINLLIFKGKAIEEGNELSWKTAAEINFSHFELQRSQNAIEFGALTNLKGTRSGYYNYIDSSPMEGISYYRLKMVDMDGSSKLSQTISIDTKNNDSFVIVENPAVNGEFKIKTNLINPKFTMTNAVGTKIDLGVSEISFGNYSIKTKVNSVGIYYLGIISGGKTTIKKVLIP